MNSPSKKGGEPSRRGVASPAAAEQCRTQKEETVRTETASIARVIMGVTLLSALTAHAAVRYVASDGGGQDGLTWTTAYRSIQAAVSDAGMGAGDEIRVKGGTYVITSPINVTKAVKILGGFSGSGDTRNVATYVTTIDGNGSTMCLNISANARVEGLTFTDGYARSEMAGGKGGAIYIFNCSPTVTNCVFSGNEALTRGGAIAAKNASGTTISNCSFHGNTAGEYGGAISTQGSDLTIRNCTFSANKSNRSLDYLGGGGIFNDQGAPTISGCTFTGNSALGGAGICNYLSDAVIEDCSFVDCDPATVAGGGIMNYNCSAMINRCLFKNNQVDSGGAIWDQSTSTIVNCIMWGNNSSRYGGAIHVESPDSTMTIVQPNITNCTIYGNSASSGGAIYAGSAKAIVRNCIIWGNNGWASGPGIYQRDIATVRVDVQHCDVQGDDVYTGTGNICVEPEFANVNTGDFELVWGSPCIDVGDDTAAGLGLLDYEQKARVIDGTEDGVAVIDLGALEFRGRYIEDYLYRVEISQSIAYDSPTGGTPSHVFLLTAETADNVIKVTFHSPGTYTYTITSASHATPATYVDTYHQTKEDGKQVWQYQGTFPSFPLLNDYGDGTYYLTLYYNDGTTQQTTFWYGVPNTSTELGRPTQRPHITSPGYDAATSSPIIFTWDACTDASVNAIYICAYDPSTGETVASEAVAPAAVQNVGLSVDEKTYNAQISFQNCYGVTTAANIPFVYGKAVTIPYRVQVPYSAIYRFWAPKAARHFYTIKAGERQKLVNKYADVWSYEGPMFNACATQCHDQLLPVYRFWSAKGGTHFYTIKEAEKNKLIEKFSDVWAFEGVAFFAYADGTQPSECQPVYRFWNNKSGTHFYTIKERERDKLINTLSNVYTYEGIAFYAYPQ
jgi:predicted outer membrane repeat protein